MTTVAGTGEPGTDWEGLDSPSVKTSAWCVLERQINNPMC